MRQALPVDEYVSRILATVRSRRALILSAAPGAGKTTRVPPALAVDGPVIVLQPRRIAARAMARRIAEEQGWRVGEEVGWHVRFERKFSADTRVLLATEGILTARLQQDPLLSDFKTIVLDEFHERSIHADLGLALARQAWRARDDLRVVVMSATLEAQPIAMFLGDCPHLVVPGRLFPLDIDYQPAQSMAAAAAELLRQTQGTVLCFLPGAPEINRTLDEVRRIAGTGTDVLPLHGSLPADEQDRAVAPAAAPRVILATNIAETSLTVPGVTAVVDSGLQKVARYDPGRGIDSLELERIAADAAEQRAGRAGRLGPGRVRRLWDAADRLRPRGDAEIHRVDLADAALAILGWGGDPRTFEWFDPPSVDRVDAALSLLQQLGAVHDGRITPLGTRMQRLPLHPRLARMLIEGQGNADVALACAYISERHASVRHPSTTESDLLSAVDDPQGVPPHVRDVARRLSDLARHAQADTPHADGTASFLRAIFCGYPDRVARRRAAGAAKFLLASGHGAVLGQGSGVRDPEFIVAVDVQAARRGEVAEAIIRMASGIDPAWLRPNRNTPGSSGFTRVVHQFDAANGRVRAFERDYYGEIVVGERHAKGDPLIVAQLLAEGYLARGWSDADVQLCRRMRFAGMTVEPGALLQAAAAGRDALSDIDLRASVGWSEARDLERLAPETLAMPSGRSTRLQYQEDGAVVAAVKLQELFGLAESPRLGARREPVVFELLAPNGRPVQTTRDLRSFWDTTYREVRKELRGRYPRHPWPEDPWTAPPTARPTRRRGP
ncbi:MAG: ATP-dependent helicase C-terminal domain-containing protein [Vicinamibacterales bacterium]